MLYRETEIRSLLSRLVNRVSTTPFTSDGLSYGKTGCALLYSYYGKLTGDDQFNERCLELIQEIFQDFNTSENSIRSTEYYSGLTGFLWVLDHLRRNEFIDLSGVDLTSYDDLVFEWTVSQLEEKNFDFFSGAGGGINYLIRKPEWVTNATDQLSKLTQLVITNKLIHQANGYYVNEEYNRREGFEPTTINYGLPHGVGGIVSFFDQAYSSLSLRETARIEIQAIIGSYNNATSNVSLSSKNNVYPNYYDPPNKKFLVQKRLGWCHSDFNQLHYNLLAIKRGISKLATPDLEEHFRKIISRKTYERNLLADPFLCHGFGGVLVYTQYLAGFIPGVDPSSFTKYCVDELLNAYSEILQPNSGENNDVLQYHVHSLFYGDTGTALALISTLRPELSTWSELILL